MFTNFSVNPYGQASRNNITVTYLMHGPYMYGTPFLLAVLQQKGTTSYLALHCVSTRESKGGSPRLVVMGETHV